MYHKLKENNLFKFVIAFSFLIVLALLAVFLVSADLTITEDGNDNKTFSIPSNSIITSASLSVDPDDTIVILNGNNLGEAKDISEDDLKNNLGSGSNTIKFLGSIASFSLSYTYYNSNDRCPNDPLECPTWKPFCSPAKKCFSIAGSCDDDGDCSPGEVCVFGDCCSDTNIMTFGIPVPQSCPGSSVPVTPIPNPACPSANDNRIPISFYLEKGGVQTSLRQGLAPCNVSGDYGWALEGVKRCEARIPSSLATGTYSFKASYVINAFTYVYTISNNFLIETSCGPDTPCGHSTGLTTIAIAPGTFSATEKADGSLTDEYYIPRGATVTITGIGAYNAQCSDGVSWTDMPGVVAWTTNARTFAQIATGDNVLFNGGSCKIPATKSRSELIGVGALEVGYLPPGCNMNMRDVKMGNSVTASVYNFPDYGTYDIFTDYINAHCDAPDYICPYIQPGVTVREETNAILCWIGQVNSRNRATGWNYLSDYKVIVVNPNINVDYLAKTDGKNNNPTYYDYNITNIGVGKVNITAVQLPSSDDFIVSSTFPGVGIIIGEGNTTWLKVGLLPKASSQRIVNSVVPYSYKNITLKDYSIYSFTQNKLTVNYSIPLNIIYDDGYGFSLQPPLINQQALDFSFEFECNGSDMKIIELQDKIFYCTCVGKGFCVHDKNIGIDNAPCACIDEPEKDKIINGTEVEFNATRSFDDITSSGDLFFNWFYDVKNEGFYNGTGITGAIFTRQFPAPGEYKIRLEVTDWSNFTGIDRSRFFLNFEIPGFELGPVCIREDGIDYWLYNNQTTSSINDCFRPDGWPSTACCPEGNRCEYVGPAPTDYSCVGEPAPWICSDYNNEDDCTKFNPEVAKRSMEIFTGIEGFCDGNYIISDVMGGKSCHRFVHDCRCLWNGSMCEQQASYSNWICDGDTEVEPSENCSVVAMLVEQREKECETTGYTTYGWKAFWTGTEPAPDWCVDNERKVRCPIKLSFFTAASLIAAVILIIVIYIWLKKRRKQKQIVKRKIRRKKKRR